jgi:hypothetical protein
MKYLKTIVLICMAMLVACTAVEQAMTAEEKAQIKTDVSDTFAQMIEDMETLDIEKFKYYNLLNEDYSTIMDGSISVGGDKAIELFIGAFSYIEEYVYLNMPVQEVIVYDRNTSMVLINFDEAYATVTGDTLKVKGTSMYLFKLVEDQWKIVQMSGFHDMGE